MYTTHGICEFCMNEEERNFPFLKLWLNQVSSGIVDMDDHAFLVNKTWHSLENMIPMSRKPKFN